MARVNQIRSEKAPVAGDGNTAGTSVEQNGISTDLNSQASTIVSLLSPPASDADATSDNQMVIYPIRSYLDGKEIHQAGGVGYTSPKHEALLLIAKGLATDQKPGA
ncbi:hypothetical protein D3C87_1242800 [compost metagenome]